TVMLRQATACFVPSLVGTEMVAGRSADAVDLGPSRCPRATEAALTGRWRLWLDRGTGLVLRAGQGGDGATRLVGGASVDVGATNDPALFVPAAPEGVPLNETRPPPNLPPPTRDPGGN